MHTTWYHVSQCEHSIHVSFVRAGLCSEHAGHKSLSFSEALMACAEKTHVTRLEIPPPLKTSSQFLAQIDDTRMSTAAAPAQTLAKLLGLDEATVTEQIFPYLSSHKSPKALRTYLQELIGTTPEALALTDDLVLAQFPHENAAAKKRESRKPVRLTPSTVKNTLAEAEEHAKPRILEPTPEMKALDTAFSMLSTEPSSPAAAAYAPKQRRVCLCQGRQHGLAQWAPLCMACGLVLCSALRPVPASPYSACPSCQASPIVPSHARTRILGEMVSLREQLAQEQAEEEARRQAERMALRRHGNVLEQAFPSLNGERASHPEPAQPKSKARTLHLDMKTHKVTVSKRTNPAASASNVKKGKENEIGTTSDMPTVAEDGSVLVHDLDDDMFRHRFVPSQPSKPLQAYSHWHDIPTVFTCTYIPASKREPALGAFESHELTEVPDLEALVQRKPPGSAADTRTRNRQNATAAAMSRSQGRKTGKPGRRKRPGS